MERVVASILEKIRRERSSKAAPEVQSGRVPSDLEAVLARCRSCSNAALLFQDIPLSRPFPNLDAFRERLGRSHKRPEPCSSCGDFGLEGAIALYCQYRQKHGLDLQVLAEKGQVTHVFVATPQGDSWELPMEAANRSIDTAIISNPKPSAAATVDVNSQEAQRQQLRVQKVLVDFEESRGDEPLIFGPRNLPAQVLEAATRFARLDPDEAPLVVVATSNSPPGCDGLLLTNSRLHSSEADFQPIRYEDLRDIDLRKGLLGSSLFVNGLKALAVKGLLEQSTKSLVDALNGLANLAPARSPGSAASSKAGAGEGERPAPLRKRTSLGDRRRVDPNSAPPLRRLESSRARETIASVSRERLRQLLDEFVSRKIPGDLLNAIEVPAERYAIARRTYAKPDTDDIPMLIVRSNLGDDASEALFTDTAIFSNEFSVPRGLRFSEIDSVDFLQEEGTSFLDVNGHPFLSQGRLPDWVLPKLKVVLDEVAGLNREGAERQTVEEPQVEAEPATAGIEPPENSRFGGRFGRRMGSSAGIARPSLGSAPSGLGGAPASRPGLPFPQPNPQASDPESTHDAPRPIGPRRTTSTQLAIPQLPAAPVPRHGSSRNLVPPAPPGVRTPRRSPSREMPAPSSGGLRAPQAPGRVPSRTSLPRPADPNLGRPRPMNEMPGAAMPGAAMPGARRPMPGRSGSGVTPPPSKFGVTRPPQQNSGPNSGFSRPLPRPRAPAINLEAIDFDVELAERANQFWRMGRLPEALQSVQDAQLVNPLNAELNYCQASIFASMGDDDSALDALLQAYRFGFARRDRLFQDECWSRLRRDHDFQILLQRIDARARNAEDERLEQLRIGLVYVLAHMTDQLPAEVRMTRCPSCQELRLDPAQADYDFTWDCLESFHLEAIAPLAYEQLRCDVCRDYKVEIIGTAHTFPLADGTALSILFWLDGGQARSRFVFQSDRNGFLHELRTFNSNSVDPRRLLHENDALLARLNSPLFEVVEGAVRDLAIPGNTAALAPLCELLAALANNLTPQHRCAEPWLLRETLQSVAQIGQVEALDSVFAVVSNLLTHEAISVAIALTVAETCDALGGRNAVEELANYVYENAPNVSPLVSASFAQALNILSEERRDPRLQDLAHAIQSLLPAY